MNKIIITVCRLSKSIKTRFYNKIYMQYILDGAKNIGKNVVVSEGSRIAGIENISFGDNVYIGPGATIYTTLANITFGSYINIGPNVTIISGDHRTDIVGKYMSLIGDTEKLPENDKDIIIEDDVWIGANVTILKGVIIGTGSIVAAGAIVTKNIPPYSKYISSNKIIPRFSQEQLTQHRKILKSEKER